MYKPDQNKQLANTSHKFLTLINEKIVPSWNFIKANVSNFANYFVEFVLQENPQLEIPVLNKDFFDECIRLTTFCPTARKSHKTFSLSLINAHNSYMKFYKEKCPDYFKMLTSHLINDRTGLAHMLKSMRNQLHTELVNHIDSNYPRMKSKEILLDYHLKKLN